MQITPYNIPKAQNSFLGSKPYRDARKNLVKESRFRYDISQTEKEERYVGSLPYEWILKFKKDPKAPSIKENTEKIYKALGRFAKDSAQTPVKHAFGCKYYKTGLYDNLKDQRGAHYLEPAGRWSENIKRLQESLNEVFEDDCEIQYIDDQSFGIVFRITIGGKPCALKVFYTDREKEAQKAPVGHGALHEIKNAIYSSNTLKPTQTSRFYCAKIPIGPETDGFMLTSFEQNSNNNMQGEKQRQEWFAQDGLYWGRLTFYDAHENNFIDGKLIDFGAVGYTFSSPKAQKMAKEFFTLISRGEAEKVAEFRQKHEGEAEFEECMAHLREYMGEEEDLATLENFAEHCYLRKLAKKIIASFKALGADYSKFENADFSEIEIEKHRRKLEEIFNNKKEF